MMCNCWEEDPESRPSFSTVAECIGKLLKGGTTPVKGSEEEADYHYKRKITKKIRNDYINTKAAISDDGYLTALPKQAGPIPSSSSASTPIPAKR